MAVTPCAPPRAHASRGASVSCAASARSSVGRLAIGLICATLAWSCGGDVVVPSDDEDMATEHDVNDDVEIETDADGALDADAPSETEPENIDAADDVDVPSLPDVVDATQPSDVGGTDADTSDLDTSNGDTIDDVEPDVVPPDPPTPCIEVADCSREERCVIAPGSDGVGACVALDGSLNDCGTDGLCSDGERCRALYDIDDPNPVYRCVVPNPDGTDDSEPCAGDDECSSGVCAFLGRSGRPGVCVSTCPGGFDACADGTRCTALDDDGRELDGCLPNDRGAICTLDDVAFCDEDLECARDGSLREGLGRCTSPPPTECDIDNTCDDGVACTIGVCEDGTCVYTPDDTRCDDGLACTSGVCDPVGGCFAEPDNAACDDGIACTQDRCDVILGCVHTPRDNLCSDGVACTLDVCSVDAGGCVNTPLDSRCDDGIACTTGVCSATDNCVYTANNSACDDGIACTDNTCRIGEGCVATPVNDRCDDGIECTVDACIVGLGCTHDDSACEADDTPTFADIRAIYDQRCGGCHIANRNNYSNNQSLASHPLCRSPDLTWGACGLERIRAGQMPQGGGCTGDPALDAGRPGCLTAEQLDTYQRWVDAGQPEN